MIKDRTPKTLKHQLPADLRGMIQYIKPLASWTNLSYSQQLLSEIKNICSNFTNGKGFMCLFCGESGTGKTMAAEVMARELGLNLYRIDLSAVVSKYIGETEKNLSRLIDAAENCGGILFFDEADALFGKRSDVHDRHDRYANIEINDLLQRMEAYRGLAILATNMKTALDEAFVRRLRFIVNFPFPSTEERKSVWEGGKNPVIPPKI